MHRDTPPTGEQPGYEYGYGYGYGEETGGAPLAQVLGVFRRHRWWILGCAALGGLIAAEWAYRAPPRYEAKAELLVEAQSNAFLENTALASDVDAPQSTAAFETQLRLAVSRDVLRRAARSLALDRNPRFNPDLPQPETEERRGPIGAAIGLLPAGARDALASAGAAASSWLAETGEHPIGSGETESAEASAPAAPEPAFGIVGDFQGRANDAGPGFEGPVDALVAGLDVSAGESAARPEDADFASANEAESAGSEELEPRAAARDRAIRRAASLLADHARAERAGRSQILEIAYSSPDPELAAEVANAIARSYVAALADRSAETSREADRLLRQRLERLGAQVRAAELEIERFRNAEELGVAGGESFADQQLDRLGKQLIDARAEATEKEARVRYIRDLIARGEGLDSVEEVANSPAVQNLRMQERDILKEIASLSLELGERHPKILALRAEIEEIQEKVLQEASFVAANMETEGRIARAKIEDIRLEIEDAKAEASLDQDAAVRLADLEREANAVRQVYETFLARSAELESRGDLEAAHAKLTAVANPPEQPSSHPPSLFVGLGFLFAGGGGFFLAYLRELLDKRLRNPRDIEDKLGLPCIGSTPKLRAGDVAADLVSKPHSYYAEAIRASLSTYLLAGGRDSPRSLAITSTAPGEGKSTFAISLAVTAARTRLKTLLVDADFRRPTVAKHLSVAPRAGLLEFLNDGADFEAVTERLENSNLDVVAGSAKTDRSIELVTDKSLADFVSEARKRYDLVIFDSPPALGLADTNIVASVVDDVLYVVEWNALELDDVKHGVSVLRSVEANVAGAILNKIDMEKQKLYDYNDFSQHYGKYKRYYAE